MTLSGNLGPVPFTAEDVGRRRRLFALGDAAIGENAQFKVSADADILFIHGAELPEPVTEMAVLGKTVTLLAEAKPFLVTAARRSPKPRKSEKRDVFASPPGAGIDKTPPGPEPARCP